MAASKQSQKGCHLSGSQLKTSNFSLGRWTANSRTTWTDWLTDYLMPSDKRNSITTKAMGLISSLLNVASSRDVLFCQLQQLQCSHHGSTKVYLCSPFLSPLLSRWQFVVAALHGFTEDLVTVVIAEVFITQCFCLNVLYKMLTALKTKRNQGNSLAALHKMAWVKKLWNPGGGQEMAVMVSQWQKILITTNQVNLCPHPSFGSLGISTKFTWIIVIKIFAIDQPS